MGRTLWEPPVDVLERTRMGKFAAFAETRTGVSFGDYHSLWAWSVEESEEFWSTLWEFFDLPASGESAPALDQPEMPFARWFPGVRLNFAESMLRLPGRHDDDVVVRSRSQSRDDVSLTAAELRELVARVRAGLIDQGIGQGDRVAAYLPNIPEALALMLATTSLGAVYTACPPEFGVGSVVDRWTQIEPSLVVAVDGYVYGGREIDRRADLDEIVAKLGLKDRLVLVPYLDRPGESAPSDDRLTWADLTARHGELEYAHVPFDHPLWVLFSSGTTGPPKPIVHGHGGVALELSKLHGLHEDLRPEDIFFWFSTTGWVMWNCMVTSLLVGSTIVMYDGDPGSRDMGELWKMAADFEVTYLGLSAPFLLQCRKRGVKPGDWGDLSGIREVGSTGAPLPAEGFEWLQDELGEHVRVVSISGGTDIVSAFVGGSPLLPVKAGEIACRQLGCRVEAWTPEGKSVVGEVGEMVVTKPMPSMPVFFWGDEDGSQYRASYFEHWPGVWRHGDWFTVHEDGHCVISGRSDATLNRGGVRFGTSEFYRVVEDLDGVMDSLIVHLESKDGGIGELILFVVPSSGRVLDDQLLAVIRQALKTRLSPRHIPDVVMAVKEVPRTLSGKKLEIPVKRILQGANPAQVADLQALANPDSLDQFHELARVRATTRV